MLFENGYDVMNEEFLLDKEDLVKVENDYLFKIDGRYKKGAIKTIGKYLNKKKKKFKLIW